MATRYVKVDGNIKWANSKYGGLFEEDPNYGGYKAHIYPTQESWERLKAAKINLETKTDDDGDYLIFKRPHEKLINGDKVVFGRPKVFFADEIADAATRDIGNGSKVSADVCIYDAGRYKGHRLEAVTVTELVKYEEGNGGGPARVEFRDGTNDPVERKKPEQEEEAKEAPPPKEKKKEVPFNDELPFDPPEEKTSKVVTRKPNPFKR